MMAFAVVGLTPMAAERAQQAAPPDIDAAELVARASQWTSRFDQNLSGLLFHEWYLQRDSRGRQQIDMSRTIGGSDVIAAGPGGRLTEANIFMLRAPTARAFVIYRDVYSENSRAVADHTNRLAKLLTDGTPKSMEQVRKLTDASARHNGGGISRNVNVPTMALEYLAQPYVRGLRLKAAGNETIDGLDVVIVEFEETARPTLVRGPRDMDVPARGRFWIHPDSGTVVRARLELASRTVKGYMDVQLRLHETLGVWVPREMTEAWQSPGRTAQGFARYDNFKRLNVSTVEIVK
jgi:hypothetical protein